MRHAFLLSSAGHLLALAVCLLPGSGAPTASVPAAVDVLLVTAEGAGATDAGGSGRAESIGEPPPAAPAPKLPEAVHFRPGSFPERSRAARAASLADDPFSADERPPDVLPAGAWDVPMAAARAGATSAGWSGTLDASKNPGDSSGPVSAGVWGTDGDRTEGNARGAASVPAETLRGGSGGEGRGRDGAAARLLRDAIRSQIVYPHEAVRRGLEGEVLLRIRIGEGGIPGEIRVARSSGVRILDEAARRGVVGAAPLPSAPGWFDVPIRFSLRRPGGGDR